MPNTILVVEDNADDSFLLTRQLSRANLEDTVKVVSDGQDALTYLLETPSRPIAVFLDLNLPRVSGMAILRRIRLEPRLRTLPVIVMTGSLDPDDALMCAALDVTIFLPKPIGVAMFTKVIEHLKATAPFVL